jgi:hypothetical protein
VLDGVNLKFKASHDHWQTSVKGIDKAIKAMEENKQLLAEFSAKLNQNFFFSE